MAKKKLKTMKEISAAEAVLLFHETLEGNTLNALTHEEKKKLIMESAAIISVDWVAEGVFTHKLNPAGFPKDIAARDFLECLRLYWEMFKEMKQDEDITLVASWNQQREELVQTVQSLAEQKRDIIYNTLSVRLKHVLDVLIANPTLSQKQLADKVVPPISIKTLKGYLSDLRDAYRVRNTRELFSAEDSLQKKS